MKTLAKSLVLAISILLSVTLGISYFSHFKLAGTVYLEPPTLLATESVTVCAASDCAGGASWIGEEINPAKCDFAAFEEKAKEEHDKGLTVIFACSTSDGTTQSRRVWLPRT